MKNRNLKLFYFHELLFHFSNSMLTLVLPVFIYRTFGSVSLVFGFIVGWNLIHGILYLPVFNVAMKLRKAKYFMMMGILFYLISLLFFSVVTKNQPIMMVPATVFYSFYISFYWTFRHWFMAVNTDHMRVGKQMSIISLIQTCISFISPIVGGMVSILVSFHATFLVGVIALALSLWPIALFSMEAHPEPYSLEKIKNMLKKKEIKSVSPGYFCEGIVDIAVNNVWLLIFAIFIGNILDLGLLVGFATLITAIAIWLAGKWFDQKERVRLITRVTHMRAVGVMTYASIFFFQNIAYIWLITFINKLTTTIQQLILDSYLYAYGNKLNPVEFMLSREFYLNISRLLTSGILAIIFYVAPPEGLWIVIFLGSLAVLGMLRVRKNDHFLEKADWLMEV